ncbi:hypothetical protein ACFY30_21370 [Streptomyces sp. NPDC000345]|uniref:hypothetical protein n=1 Tax=Streptomyces sp. NPDC000345 TaxID=3364537 RepID=UPI0036972253
MGIRMHHRRTATARVHTTATADTRVDPDAAAAPRPLPARAPGAATPRVPGTPATALRAAAARLSHPRPARLPARLVTRFPARLVPRDGSPRPWAERARGRLRLALGSLGRLRGPRRPRRIEVFVATTAPLSARPDGSAAP